MQTQLKNVLTHYWEGLLMLLPKLLLAAVILIVSFLIARRLRNLVQKRAVKRLEDPLLARFLAKITKWAVVLVGLSLALHFVDLGGIARGFLATAGLSGIVIGFAFRDIGENFLAGVLLAFNRPFRIGDTVETNNIKGVIKTLDLRNTHIRSFDGKDIYVPNAVILKNPLFNFTRDGLLRFDFALGIDYFDDAETARRLVLTSITKQDGILTDPPPFVITEELGKNTVNLKAFYWVNLFEYRGSALELKTRIQDDAKSSLLESGFNFTSDITELKIYQEKNPIPVKVVSSGTP